MRIIDFSNTVTDGARSFKSDQKVGAPEDFNLFKYPGHADAQRFHLLTVRIGKSDCHKFAVRRFESKRQARSI
jgi:hypothetical protein